MFGETLFEPKDTILLSNKPGIVVDAPIGRKEGIKVFPHRGLAV
jgi:hypothetical protein